MTSAVNAEAFRPCIVIPFYNHPQAIATVLNALRPLGLICFLVDDASVDASRFVLDEIERREASWLQVLRHPINRGKGAAVMTGCNAAYAKGFTHALQIDADGQHETSDASQLLAQARARPRALVTGIPIYDDSVPRSRLYGRYVTHVWVWINTLSLTIKDSMCGFRVYPLAECAALWNARQIGERMEFDVEVMVRLYWRGIDVVSVPTRVVYPLDGVSHFDVWRDNLRISGMHARLFLGMLVRSPLLIARRISRLFHARTNEVAA